MISPSVAERDIHFTIGACCFNDVKERVARMSFPSNPLFGGNLGNKKALSELIRKGFAKFVEKISLSVSHLVNRVQRKAQAGIHMHMAHISLDLHVINLFN